MNRKCEFNLLSFWLIFVFYSENLKTAFAVLHIAASNHAMLMLISVSRPGPGQHFPWQPFFPEKNAGWKNFLYKLGLVSIFLVVLFSLNNAEWKNLFQKLFLKIIIFHACQLLSCRGRFRSGRENVIKLSNVHIDTMSPANTRPHHVSTQNVFELIELNAVFN